jgi:2'-5' RNA ligase
VNDGIRISVQILLPEAIDRRFARRVAELEGASWPEWGGHITLMPSFVPQIPVEEVLARVTVVCLETEPFLLHLAEPSAHPDTTRPGYQAVFLTIPEDADPGDYHRLQTLRDRLMAALADACEIIRPELAEQPFMPHVTLALSLSENEAQRLIRDLRADGIQAAFRVDAIWLLTTTGEGKEAKLERTAIPLGAPLPINLLSD